MRHTGAMAEIAAVNQFMKKSAPCAIAPDESGWTARSSRVGLHLLFSFAVAFTLVLSAFSQNQSPAPTYSSPLEQAEKLLRENKPQDALGLLNQTVKENPKLAGLERMIGKAYLQTRQYSEAIAHLGTALQQDNNDLEASELLALSFYGSGNCHDALPLLEKLKPHFSNESPDSPYLLSICYLMTQQWEKARKALAEMFSVSPDSGMAYLALGKLLVRQHMVEAAVPQIETALRLEPRLAMAHFLLGEIDLYQSNTQAAVGEFQKELAVNPTLWLVYWRLGDAYIRLENYNDAEKVLKEAIWLNEASPDAYVLLGKIAMKKNDAVLASQFLERALSLAPQNFDAHEALAGAYQKLGRAADANRQMELAKRLRGEKPPPEKELLQSVP
ncbi:MAG TPA: tetratricopeptide repeat protein [Candidatus Sulfotelmatobacter sp.]|nr:tetratricopeptide repeat protein [Candidatus Sulfotelmatobacter sp.]